MYVSIGGISKIVGISIVTLRRYDRSGKLKPKYRTSGKHRRYCVDEVLEFFGLREKSETRVNICYGRVSSSDQKDDLVRQMEKLEVYAREYLKLPNTISIRDLGSGINYKKKGLKTLISMIIQGRVDTIYVTHRDRLLRFGFQLIENLCIAFGSKIVIIEKAEESSFEIQLAFDVLEIITVFSARLYGKRSHKGKKNKVIVNK
jgi:putative resolvase